MTTSLEFTQGEIKLLLEIINAVNFKGDSIEQVYPLKIKIKSALDEESESDKGDKENDKS